MPRHPERAAAALVLAAGCGLGLEPYDLGDEPPEREVTEGVDMKGNTYALDLPAAEVLRPAALRRMLQEVSRDTLLVNVPEQGATSFLLAVAVAAADGGQDACETVYTLGPGTWEDTTFSAEGDKVALLFDTRHVLIEPVALTATVDADTEAWSDVRLAGDLDTRQIRGVAFPEGEEPCDRIEAEGDTCHACAADGVRTCTDLLVSLPASLVDVDFDPEPSGCR